MADKCPGGENIIAPYQRNLRSAFGKSKNKKWEDQADRSQLQLLGDNKILVNGSRIIEIDYTNFVKEFDVAMEIDEDWEIRPMPPLPAPTATNCQAPSCRWGCICTSINQGSIERRHCGKPKCFFQCTCQLTAFSTGDDGDIRSRLRPRVSLLNWPNLESAERDADQLEIDKQLETGATGHRRTRRRCVPPKRFRNGFTYAYKIGTRSAISGLNLPINQQAVTRKLLGKKYRRNFVGKPNKMKTKESVKFKRQKTYDCNPCTVNIKALKSVAQTKTPVVSGKAIQENELVSNIQSQLFVPPVIVTIVEDSQMILMGSESLCFFAWTLDSRQPRAVIYTVKKGDVMPIPWLYLPVPSVGEAWVFHQVTDSLNNSTFTYIPDINCVIPSKALLMNFNMAQARKRGVALEILWIGQDSKKRMGHIYILPEIPGLLLCGPFPKTQICTINDIKTRKLSNAINVSSYIDRRTKKRYMGDDQSWNSFFSSNSPATALNFAENLRLPEIEEQETINEDDDSDVIPEEIFMQMIPGFVSPTKLASNPSNNRMQKTPLKLHVTWMQAVQKWQLDKRPMATS